MLMRRCFTYQHFESTILADNIALRALTRLEAKSCKREMILAQIYQYSETFRYHIGRERLKKARRRLGETRFKEHKHCYSYWIYDPSSYLVILCQYIEKVTGHKHLSEVADLLDRAASTIYAFENRLDESSIAKRIQRFPRARNRAGNARAIIQQIVDLA